MAVSEKSNFISQVIHTVGPTSNNENISKITYLEITKISMVHKQPKTVSLFMTLSN